MTTTPGGSLKPIRIGALGALAALAACAPANASVPHTVAPGETLWSIAAANGMSTSALAAANGISPETNVVLGDTIQIPPSGGTGATAGTGTGTGTSTTTAQRAPAHPSHSAGTPCSRATRSPASRSAPAWAFSSSPG